MLAPASLGELESLAGTGPSPGLDLTDVILIPAATSHHDHFGFLQLIGVDPINLLKRSVRWNLNRSSTGMDHCPGFVAADRRIERTGDGVSCLHLDQIQLFGDGFDHSYAIFSKHVLLIILGAVECHHGTRIRRMSSNVHNPQEPALSAEGL